jgi:UDP-N-acetylglucosamine 2-epimerase (non-hydrolysing)/GDP/UDP-N,N'-diacetylbacillosamine 2-epimerase (hydrolysing)
MVRRRILATLESRATYGYSRNVMRAMRDFPELELMTLVTGMHLMPEFGSSIDLIRADEFPISATVPMSSDDSTRSGWSRALGRAIDGIAVAYEDLAPDIVIIFGDRAETFGCCVAASYMGIPVAHVQAGDKSGHIDDAARMALGKLAHIHLASCEDSADRLRRLGEQDFRIFNVGAPQLDDVVTRDFSARSITISGKAYDLSTPYLLVVQHPLMSDYKDAGDEIGRTLTAVLDTGLPVFCIYPNSDLGYRGVIREIENRRGDQKLHVLSNVERDDFLTLLANCAALVGNSSSGILEAPSFRVPVINIGERQRGRPQASNILNCRSDRVEISAALALALADPDFRAQCAQAINPYGDGKSGPRIARILADIPLDRRLIDKETTY